MARMIVGDYFPVIINGLSELLWTLFRIPIAYRYPYRTFVCLFSSDSLKSAANRHQNLPIKGVYYLTSIHRDSAITLGVT